MYMHVFYKALTKHNIAPRYTLMNKDINVSSTIMQDQVHLALNVGIFMKPNKKVYFG